MVFTTPPPLHYVERTLVSTRKLPSLSLPLDSSAKRTGGRGNKSEGSPCAVGMEGAVREDREWVPGMLFSDGYGSCSQPRSF